MVGARGSGRGRPAAAPRVVRARARGIRAPETRRHRSAADRPRASSGPALAYDVALAGKLPTSRGFAAKTRPEQCHTVCERLGHAHQVNPNRAISVPWEPMKMVSTRT